MPNQVQDVLKIASSTKKLFEKVSLSEFIPELVEEFSSDAGRMSGHSVGDPAGQPAKMIVLDL